MREFRKLTLSELQGYISEIKTMTFGEIQKLANGGRYGRPRRELPALRAWVLSMAYQGIRLGDHRAFDVLMDRVVGRVADQINIKAKLEKDVKAKSDAELIEEARELIAALGGGKK